MLPPDTCLCRECGWIGVPYLIGRCPECHSRYLRAFASATPSELLAIIIKTCKEN